MYSYVYTPYAPTGTARWRMCHWWQYCFRRPSRPSDRYKHITQRLVHCQRPMKRLLMANDGLCLAAELMFSNRSWQLVQYNTMQIWAVLTEWIRTLTTKGWVFDQANGGGHLLPFLLKCLRNAHGCCADRKLYAPCCQHQNIEIR